MGSLCAPLRLVTGNSSEARGAQGPLLKTLAQGPATGGHRGRDVTPQHPWLKTEEITYYPLA